MHRIGAEVRKLLVGLLFGFAVVAVSSRTGAAAAPCKPPQSAALLTGPVYDAITAECDWVDALNRRDAHAARNLLDPSFTRIDAAGAVQHGSTALSALSRVGTIGISGITVPFSAGSTNVVISTWTVRAAKTRVVDVFFCNVRRTCRYRLISEQLTRIGP